MNVAIVGAGKLGVTITEAFLGSGIEVTLIDKRAEILEKTGSQFDLLTVTGNAKNTDVLKQIKIDTYDHLIACTDNDEKNIVICRFAKEMGCPSVIARVRDPEHVNQLEFIKKAAGIDYIINPDLSVANEIYKYLVEKYTLSNGLLSMGDTSILEFSSNKIPVIINKQVKNVGRILDRLLIIAISRLGKIIIPRGDTVITEDDSLYVLGPNEEIQKLSQIVHEQNAYTDLQHVMIAGGGKTGYYLAKKLDEFGVSVKIIEVDRDRCQYLSEHLNDVLVLHGNATDPVLLEEENIDEMDAFVSATGFDEENLLLALMANQHNIEDVVAKISRKSYSSLIEKLGVSMALNPQDISASNVLRYVQGSKRILFSKLIQGQAEFIEILADKDMKLTNTPMAELDLPEGALIVAVHRGDESIVPDGSTVIQEGDKVIIFCLLSKLPLLEKLFQSKKLFLRR